jgi:hypothetical protein
MHASVRRAGTRNLINSDQGAARGRRFNPDVNA